jgi:hypothetical protein
MEGQIELMVTYLVHLQFYSEEGELLYSRDKKSSIHIPGIGAVISAFVKELLKPIENIINGEYRTYLTRISEVLPVDIDAIEEEFNNQIMQLPEEQRTPELIVNFLVGPIRSELQNHVFEVLMSQIQRLAATKISGEKKEDAIEQRLKEVYSRNDKTVALLYNLVFLRLLIKIYGSEDLYQRVNDIVYYYQNALVNLLVRI